MFWRANVPSPAEYVKLITLAPVGVWFAYVRHCTPEGGGDTGVVDAYTSTFGNGSAFVVRGS